MKENRRKLTAVLLAAVMLLSLFPVAALAGQEAEISLDQAIQVVKQNFVIPAQCSEFSSGFRTDDESSYWSLRWYDSEDRSISFRANIDADTGEIIYMVIWQGNPEEKSSLPVISIADARQKGNELLQRLIPKRFADLQEVEGNQIIPLSNYGTYSLRWERVSNGIPVIGDSASIAVNLRTGEISRYRLQWSKKELPSPEGVISQEEAEKAFADAEMLKMQYLIPSQNWKADKEKQKNEPILVYCIDHKSNGIIDAFTGEPVESEDGNSYSGGIRGGYCDGMGSREKAAKLSLSPQEEQEIAQTAKLISQEEAVAALKKYLKIPAKMECVSANLEQNDYINPEGRTWNLQWRSKESDKGSSTYIYGKVNALTAEVMSFDVDNPATADKKASLKKDAAQKIANKFIKKIQPERYKEVKLEESNAGYWRNPELKAGEIPQRWNFNYVREINGVKCPGNGFRVSIDTANKSIVSYNYSWTNKEFPQTEGVLGQDEANEAFWQLVPLQLAYSKVYSSSGYIEGIKLAYQPRNIPGCPYVHMIDAFNGEGLDWDGQSAAEKIHPFVFNDISGHFAEKEIALLGQAGIFGEYDSSFHPDENIRIVSLLRAMLSLKNSIYYTLEMSDEQIMKEAKKSWGWLEENMAADSAVTRGQLARLMISFLDIEYLAHLEGIYKVPYQDAANISAEMQGYAALTWGLGIIKGDGNNFVSDHIVSRAETAVALVRILGVENQQ